MKQLDLVLTFYRPGFDGFALLDPQVIEYQEHLLACIIDQRLQKPEQPVQVEGYINKHPAGLALVGYGGNHR